jgi:hypothetical protein
MAKVGQFTQRSRGCNMSTKRKQKPDDPEQSKRFIEAAREASADETEERADREFKRVAKPQSPKKG